jgi:hypothetical protein
MRSRTWIDLQVALLAAGTLFAGSVVATDLYRFTLTGGDLNQFGGTALPNPLTTACFYAAVVFAAALRWAVVLQRGAPDHTKQRRLAWLLAGGTVFALGNAGYACYASYATQAPGGAPFCSSMQLFSPLETPCFVGFVLYLAAFLGTVAVARSLRQQRRAAAPARPRLGLHDRVA